MPRPASHDGAWLQRCASFQASHSFESAPRILLLRPSNGLGNQLLNALSSIILACLTRRHLFIEDPPSAGRRLHPAPQGASFLSAVRLRWEHLRNATAPRAKYLGRGRWLPHGSREEAHVLDLTAAGNATNHVNLVCGEYTSSLAVPDSARTLLIVGETYFLKALLANPFLRKRRLQPKGSGAADFASVCPNEQLDRCFQTLFEYFFSFRADVRERERKMEFEFSQVPCAVGIHMRSGGTISSRGLAVGAQRFAHCAHQLLPKAQSRTTYAPLIHLATGTEDARVAFQKELGATRQALLLRYVRSSSSGHRESPYFEWREVLNSWGPALPKYAAEQMVSAAADLLALSGCKVIIGTRHSTFSYVAQALGSRRQARIYDEIDGHHGDARHSTASGPNETTSCRLYEFTQPAYHAWARYAAVRRKLPSACAAELKQKPTPSFDLRELRAARVFATEAALPFDSQ